MFIIIKSIISCNTPLLSILYIMSSIQIIFPLLSNLFFLICPCQQITYSSNPIFRTFKQTTPKSLIYISLHVL